MLLNAKTTQPQIVHQFAILTQEGCVVVDRDAVLLLLEGNAKAASKTDLTMGPVIRDVSDRFRQWSRECEPGWVFQAVQINFSAIRIASRHPVYNVKPTGEGLKIAAG